MDKTLDLINFSELSRQITGGDRGTIRANDINPKHIAAITDVMTNRIPNYWRLYIEKNHKDHEVMFEVVKISGDYRDYLVQAIPFSKALAYFNMIYHSKKCKNSPFDVSPIINNTFSTISENGSIATYSLREDLFWRLGRLGML